MAAAVPETPNVDMLYRVSFDKAFLNSIFSWPRDIPSSSILVVGDEMAHSYFSKVLEVWPQMRFRTASCCHLNQMRKLCANNIRDEKTEFLIICGFIGDMTEYRFGPDNIKDVHYKHPSQFLLEEKLDSFIEWANEIAYRSHGVELKSMICVPPMIDLIAMARHCRLKVSGASREAIHATEVSASNNYRTPCPDIELAKLAEPHTNLQKAISDSIQIAYPFLRKLLHILKEACRRPQTTLIVDLGNLITMNFTQILQVNELFGDLKTGWYASECFSGGVDPKIGGPIPSCLYQAWSQVMPRTPPEDFQCLSIHELEKLHPLNCSLEGPLVPHSLQEVIMWNTVKNALEPAAPPLPNETKDFFKTIKRNTEEDNELKTELDNLKQELATLQSRLQTKTSYNKESISCLGVRRSAIARLTKENSDMSLRVGEGWIIPPETKDPFDQKLLDHTKGMKDVLGELPPIRITMHQYMEIPQEERGTPVSTFDGPGLTHDTFVVPQEFEWIKFKHSLKNELSSDEVE